MNLLEETIEYLKNAGKKTDEIIFIGSEETGHECTWDEFVELANIDYDNLFGEQEVASDLIIVFRDGSKMRRHEYHGAESWSYSTPFVRPPVKKAISRLIVRPSRIGWKDLSEVQEESA
ncbi:hypothetical protein [Thiothrix sp.]|jgi:hypothetical protein|uniref:hypothetical protein n=1 Tax=Thiothrix sp. TaxID=1032 RepID=UPI0025811A9F|nr:hypothetical protein [Thiothrix sp.]